METNNRYGYVRINSKSQDSNSSIESQKQQLIQNKIEEENIFIEVESGANEIRNNSVFQKLINQKLKANDFLTVTKIDRCSRNTLEFLKLQNILFKKNITFVVLELPTSVDLATNKLMARTLSTLAEFENNRRKERQKKRIRAAQKEGKYQGRKTVINKVLIQKVKHLKETKNLSVTDISKLIRVSSPTVYKILKEYLGYVFNPLVKVTERNEERKDAK